MIFSPIMLEELKQPLFFIYFCLVITLCNGKITTSSEIMKFSYKYMGIDIYIFIILFILLPP